MIGPETSARATFMRLLLAAGMLHLTLPGAQPALFRRSGGGTGRRSSAITLRKRLHVNTLITPPGEMEVEWGGAFSVDDGGFTMPSSIKYTPEGSHVYWGRTE